MLALLSRRTDSERTLAIRPCWGKPDGCHRLAEASYWHSLSNSSTLSRAVHASFMIYTTFTFGGIWGLHQTSAAASVPAVTMPDMAATLFCPRP